VESQSWLELSLLTALAEGADTIAANAATQHYLIDVVLPFAPDVYSQDFNGAALDDFQALCNEARSTLVLPGKRELPRRDYDPEANKAYEAAGLTVIGNCDILLTVWDEGESGGRGGTTEMLAVAASLDVPIIEIDAGGAKPTRVRWSGLEKFPVRTNRLDALPSKALGDALPQLMDDLVRPPDKPAELAGLRRHFKARFHCGNPGWAYPALQAVLFVRRPQPVDLFPERVRGLFTSFLSLLRPAVGKGLPPSNLLRAYAWADAIGLYFAQFFRSAFVLNFFVAAFAVAAALLSLFHRNADLPPKIEILFILIVAANTILGRHYGWHNRWFEAREVAERLRVASVLWMLGVKPQSFSGNEPAWTGWYVRALVRMQPLRSCSFDRAALDGARAATLNILRDQCEYHARNAHRMKRLEVRLEWFGIVLFTTTVLVVVDHLFHLGALHCLMDGVLHQMGWNVHNFPIALSAFLPVLATATYGIRVIGDFEGAARRSERAHESLSQQIAALRQDPENLELLRRRARAAGEIMLGDVASWRLAVESRGLAIPG
jgi:hypothetical protein